MNNFIDEQRHIERQIGLIEIRKSVFEAMIILTIIAGGFALNMHPNDWPLSACAAALGGSFSAFWYERGRIMKLQKTLEKILAG